MVRSQGGVQSSGCLRPQGEVWMNVLVRSVYMCACAPLRACKQACVRAGCARTRPAVVVAVKGPVVCRLFPVCGLVAVV